MSEIDLMTRFRPTLPGLQRIVLINSGIYQLAEIEVFNAIELVALNGTGKSALINTLQYLYIDQQRSMLFPGHEPQATREFYFGDAYKYLLFECRTYGGIVTVMFRGTGVTQNYQPDRFVFTGPYERGLFVDPDTGIIRHKEQVDIALEARGFRKIRDASEQRSLLISGGEKAGTGWGLVPLKSENLYPRFRNSFRRLLHLRDVSQEELKEVLFDYAGLSATKQEIRFDKKFSSRLNEIMAGRDQIARLEEHTSHIETATRMIEEEGALRRKAFVFYRETMARIARFEETFREEKQRREAALSGEEEKRNEREKACDLLEKENDELTKASGVPERELADIRKREAHFREVSFDPDLKEMERVTRKNRVDELNYQVRDAGREKPEVWERRLREKQANSAQKKQALDQVENLLVTRLRQTHSDEEIAQLAGLFNPAHLETPLGAGVCIRDAAAFEKRIAALLANISGDSYRDDAVEILLPEDDRIAGIGRPETLAEELATLAKEIADLEVQLATARDMEARRQELAKEEAELRKLEREIEGYAELQNDLKRVPDLEKSQAELEAKIAEVKERQKQAQAALRECEEAIRAANVHLGKLSSEREQVYREQRELSAPAGDAPDDLQTERFAFPESLLDLLRATREAVDQLKSLRDKLDFELRRLESVFTESAENHAGDSAAFLAELRDDLDAAEDTRRALDQRWRSFLTINTAAFRDLLKSKDVLARKTSELSKKMSQVSISNVREVRLIIKENSETVRRVETFANGSDEISLFDDVSEVDRIMRDYEESVRRGDTLTLSEMITVGFKVTHANGSVQTYDSFQNIISTGTNVILKILLNLVVIQAYLVPGKALIPFYLDEVHVLDKYNVRTILRMARELGFQAIFAAPKVVDGIDACYHITPNADGSVKGLIVGKAQRQDFVRGVEGVGLAD